MRAVGMVLARARTVSLLLLAGACRPAEGPGTVVEFWAMGREGEVVQQMVPDFERRVPGVRVRVQQIPWSAAHEKVLTAYVGHALPDVVQVGNTWLSELVALGALETLDGRMATSATVRPEGYFAGVFDTNVIDEGTYGVPWYVDTRVLFYRTDAFRDAGYGRPPATWEAWLDAVTRIKARAGRDRYALLLPITEWQLPVILALQRGGSLLRDGGRYGDFRAPPFRDGFAFYLDLFRRDLAPRTGEAQVANLYQDFANGYFALYVSGPWNIGEFQHRLPAAMAGRWSTAPLPGLEERTPGVSLAGGASLVVTRSARNKDAAWQWIEYLSEPARQVEFYRLTGDLPARTGAWEDPALRDSPHTQAFWTQLQHVRATPKLPEWERIASKIGEYAEAAIRGRMSSDDALAALDHDTDAILEKRRWLLDRGRTIHGSRAVGARDGGAG